MQIAVLHGSNLNRLGVRRPDKYGRTTLAEITSHVDDTATRLGARVVHHQSNHEGDLVEFVHDHQHDWAGIVLNPAGFSSSGYSLLDAVRDTGHPFAIVHISQWHAVDGRERTDIFATSATTYVAGAGWRGYSLALEALVHKIRAD
jgi:3-dehydroquinate dehydratase-2